jgi:DNA-binding NtrC family response regulator
VLIVGESGTGKELVARALHELSERADGPYVALNCSALSAGASESDPFRGGHAHVGADRSSPGVFAQATRGTLLLDEVAEMPLELQARLLRVLENGAVDLRFLAATNRQPDQAVKQGKLREDLFYRLKVFQLSLSSLRDRPEDITVLAEHFLRQTTALEGRPKQFTPEALAVLETYAWPGNVRELKNAVYSAYIKAGAEITVECLPPEITTPADAPEPTDTVPISVGMSAAEAEQRLIVATLAHFDGCKWKSAETLGISLKTLYNRLQEYRRAGSSTCL